MNPKILALHPTGARYLDVNPVCRSPVNRRDWSEESRGDMTIESRWIETSNRFEGERNNNNNLSSGFVGRNYRWRKVGRTPPFFKDDELFKSGSSYHSHLRCEDKFWACGSSLQETVIFLQIYVYIRTYIHKRLFLVLVSVRKPIVPLGLAILSREREREINSRNNPRNTGEREHTC